MIGVPFKRALAGKKSNSIFRAVLGVDELTSLAESVKPEPYSMEFAYDYAVACGMLPPMADPYAPEDDPFTLEMSAFDVADPRAVAMAMQMSCADPVKFEIDWNQLERTPELMKFQDSAHTWHFPVACPGLQNHELAKFIVQKNEVGVVCNIQTGLNMLDNVFEQAAPLNWRWPMGDPFYYTRQVLYSTAGPGYPAPVVLWHLRIERLDPNGVDPANWRTYPPNFLPGSPFERLPEWDEMRFIYGTDHFVHLVVPENSLLSLWIQRLSPLEEDTPVRDVSGILQGFTQPQGSPRTYENLTRSY